MLRDCARIATCWMRSCRILLPSYCPVLTFSLVLTLPSYFSALSGAGGQGNPMAFLVEKGGGRAITGRSSVLDLQPQKIHERSAIFLGSREDVDRIEALYRTPN